MSDGSGEAPLDTWRVARGSTLWALPSVAIGVLALVYLTMSLVGALLDGDRGAVVALSAFGAFAGMVGRRFVLPFTSRVEVRREGLTVVDIVRRRRIPWVDVARIEIDQVDFPTFRGRGPCVMLVLIGGRRIRLWATEQTGWGHSRRDDTLHELADDLRRLRREYGEPTVQN
jgi:Bacterial PH domain